MQRPMPWHCTQACSLFHFSAILFLKRCFWVNRRHSPCAGRSAVAKNLQTLIGKLDGMTAKYPWFAAGQYGQYGPGSPRRTGFLIAASGQQRKNEGALTHGGPDS